MAKGFRLVLYCTSIRTIIATFWFILGEVWEKRVFWKMAHHPVGTALCLNQTEGRVLDESLIHNHSSAIIIFDL
jgi:hypothetical protein